MDTVIEVFGLTGEKGSTEVRLCSCISWDKVLKIWSLLFQDVNWSTVLWFWKKQLLWDHCHVIEDLKPLVLIPVRDKVLGMPNSARQFICFAEIIVQ